jgi:hypothetical protein
MTVAASMPPMTTVPMMRRETAPAPVAVQRGTVPRINANEVYCESAANEFLRRRESGVNQRPAFVFQSRELDDQMAFLAARPISMTRPI